MSYTKNSLIENLKVLLQYLLPKHLVSVLAGKLAGIQTPWLKNLMIKRFAKAYKIDMSIAEEPELTFYKNFNHFFTRSIRLDTRPIDSDENSLCSPVDGAISQFGAIAKARIIQAKKRDYSVIELLGGSQSEAELFIDGQFCTIYLAPKDYHRIHMPCDGELLSMTHIPGQLFSVNPLTARNVPKLFARNERVVSLFSTSFGKIAIVAVGATIVGSIETIWAGTITPPTRNSIARKDYPNNSIRIAKGDEMGRFKLGSTVIILTQKNNWQWQEKIQLEQDLILGEKLLSISN